jgi:Tfp pilus assembly protein PilP
MKKKFLVFCSLLLIMIASMVVAQEKKDDKKDTAQTKKTTAQEEDEVVLDKAEAGEYVYRPRGRRDPFWDLLRGRDAEIRKRQKEGIAGLEIEQLELEGIVFKDGKYIALFKGPDNKFPYDVGVGQSVYDGEIIKIDANRVVFKQILTIALGGTKEKTVTKYLNPEKENVK